MVSIEVGTTADADAAADLWVELAEGQREYDSHLLPAENRQTLRESIAQHAVADELLVARADESDADGESDDREIVGFVTVDIESSGYEQDAVRGVVRNIYVVPARRGEGVGSALLDAAETRLAEAGADAVSLDVMAENADARRFYRRHGYAPHRVELEKSVESDTLTKE
ncbi:GNAT family N-acetyltransferase [Halorussus gelatinilyticus]|uniref:GNAT family N-acetyltransferase n=1 Tax=Halorussus gelatinilyticus TaxID=2937524 RepID=A0A8U0II00_9EURY|nr:GNAT family N-acetyltransferase [Halorussus gelatinilyticus]UPW00448.1 GNAT family N-acetyltransferase [Halorussus gelatinilyticus]